MSNLCSEKYYSGCYILYTWLIIAITSTYTATITLLGKYSSLSFCCFLPPPPFCSSAHNSFRAAVAACRWKNLFRYCNGQENSEYIWSVTCSVAEKKMGEGGLSPPIYISGVAQPPKFFPLHTRSTIQAIASKKFTPSWVCECFV